MDTGGNGRRQPRLLTEIAELAISRALRQCRNDCDDLLTPSTTPTVSAGRGTLSDVGCGGVMIDVIADQHLFLGAEARNFDSP
jgi:hypothetical protein